jgi:hypothetical protein
MYPEKPYVPKVGEWKCGRYSFYNIPFDNKCLGNDVYHEDPEQGEIACLGYRRDAVYV